MGNSLRCCLACVLPCGALDLIRIVHLSGHVEEIARPVTAGEILKANPDHFLSTPSSEGVVRKIMILSPETELRRGGIYFLIPNSSLPADKKKSARRKKTPTTAGKSAAPSNDVVPADSGVTGPCKRSASSRLDRRAGRVDTWQPHLPSISEGL